MTKIESEILAEAQAYSAALDRREERREVYMMVAKTSIYRDDEGDMYWKPEATKIVAEAIYQGMLKFVGDKT